MSVLSPAEATAVLDAHAPDGELWPTHCRQVARVARTVADALLAAGASLDQVLDPWWGDESAPVVDPKAQRQALQPADLEAWALVHDIGRCVNHGPLHGWIGWRLLADLGHPSTARGCLTHWLKGRSSDELRAASIEDDLIAQVAAALHPLHWRLADSVLSFADSSVAGKAIVPLAVRHADLRARYGESTWMDRHEELGERAAAQISAALDRPLAELLAPLYDSQPDHA
jgi:hypothetical protein